MSKPETLECVNCHKRTTRIEAEDRNFNTGFCGHCGYGLEPVMTTNKLDIDYKKYITYADGLSAHVIEDIDGFEQAIEAYIAERERLARIDELELTQEKWLKYNSTIRLSDTGDHDAQVWDKALSYAFSEVKDRIAALKSNERGK